MSDADSDRVAFRLANENARLRQEVERLHTRCEDLIASSETWIRLYEAALERAEGAEKGRGVRDRG